MPGREGLRPYSRLRAKCGVAWFTTRSSVQFDAGTLTVSTMSKLSIEGMRVVSGASAADAGATSTSVIAQNSPLGAVSSATGEHFFAETTLGSDVAFTAIDTQAAVNTLKGANNKYCDYLKYNFKITAAASDDGAKDLYVSLASPTITGTHIGNWYRIAIYTYTDADGTLDNTAYTTNSVFAKTYATDNGGEKRVDSAVITAVGGTTGSATREKVSDLTAGDGVELKDSFQETTSPTATTTSEATIFVCVAVWMEGSAAADQNEAGGDTLQLDFSFSLQAHA